MKSSQGEDKHPTKPQIPNPPPSCPLSTPPVSEVNKNAVYNDSRRK